MEDPTLFLHWFFSSLALLVMGVRLTWKKVLKQPYNLGDYLTMGACTCCIIRMAFIHIVLTWGTNNIPDATRATIVFTPEIIQRRELGSKLAVANRVFYNSFLWLQKGVLLDVYRRILSSLRYERVVIWSFITVFVGTYVATQVTTFSECRPFHLYWQVVPPPGPCAGAQLQLIVVGVTNIVTDVMLLAVPIPLFFSIQTSWKIKLRLYVLFTLGIFIVVITVVRLPINAINKNSQVNRSMWASTELFTATIVVNAPTMYGLWKSRQQQSGYSQSYGDGTKEPRHHNRTQERYLHSDNNVDTQVYALSDTLTGRRPSDGGILQVNEVIVTEHRVPGNGLKKPDVKLDEAEVGSNSSQRGILTD